MRIDPKLRCGLAALLALSFAAGIDAPVWSHPADKTKNLPPSKAQADLAEARRLLDVAKTKLTESGRFACCIKPPEGSKVTGCDICARNNGSCACAANLAAGKGVCGQCKGGWEAGRGLFPNVKKEQVTLLASPAQKSDDTSAAAPPELARARQALNKAKRTLVAEGRYACCITNGGCDECAFEMSCPCGGEVAEGAAGTGVCGSCLDGWHAGHGAFAGVSVAEIKLAPMDPSEGTMRGGQHAMQGMFGPWSMTREASGTSWIPESSPMYATMGRAGPYETMVHGYGYGAYTDQGGRRGDQKLYIASQIMGMAQRRFGDGGVVGARAMLSADPMTMGKRGYPLLFQTGETAGGQPLVDRQHPHDLFMELAFSYARPLGGGLTGSLYLAPVGEPAIGPPAFPHRPSAFDNPEAPLSHHWFDATHITYGVATLGVATDRVKVEGSVFTGREPDENRYGFDKMRFDSYAGRVTVNPTRNLSLQLSHAFLKSPEELEAATNQHRTTLSALFNRPLAGGDNWQTLFGFARNRKSEPGEERHDSDAYTLESALLRRNYTLFGRIEWVDKDELFPGSGDHTAHRVNKFTLGGVKNIARARDTEIGVGGSFSAYAFPSALKASYGASPVSFNLFLRVRTGRM